MGEPLLKRGNKGPRVVEAQHLLNLDGAILECDGHFGKFCPNAGNPPGTRPLNRGSSDSPEALAASDTLALKGGLRHRSVHAAAGFVLVSALMSAQKPSGSDAREALTVGSKLDHGVDQ